MHLHLTVLMCAVIRNKDESGSLYIYNYTVIILDHKIVSCLLITHDYVVVKGRSEAMRVIFTLVSSLFDDST